MKKISIVVPCFNEEKNVVHMYKAIKKIISEMSSQYAYEIIFIDNCSSDNTENLLREIAHQDSCVKIILNNRNFGPDASSYHAILSATGDAVIGIACDFQDPPEMIPSFIKEWEKGAMVVWGQKIESEESRCMHFLRNVYYYIIRKLSYSRQYDHVTGFGLLDKKVIKQTKEMKDPWPLIRNMIPQLGYVPVLLPYKQKKREQGKSSYNFAQYFDTALNSLVHTSKIPMKMATYLGLILAVISFFTGLFYLFYKLCYWNSFALGQAPIIIILCFITSILLIFLGILGEYMLSILDRVSFWGYVIEKERINFDDTENS